MQHTPAPTRRAAGDILATGFGITVCMWAIGYIGRLPELMAPNQLLVPLMLACPLLGGVWLSGRVRSIGRAVGAGALSGTLNLLILGSLLAGSEPNQVPPSALWWVPGSIGISALLTAIGFGLGRALRRGRPLHDTNWQFSLALVAGLATLVLLKAGGMVTGYQAGLAVPDWPNSYHYNMFLYPLSRMTGGIYFEHAHRLLGSLVGLTTLTLAIYTHIVEPRRWVRWLGWGAFGMVCIQGLLGGLRVTGKLTLSADAAELAPNLGLAIVHGVFGQVFFATLVSLAVIASRPFRVAQPLSAPRSGVDPLLGLACVVLLAIQIVLGALQRHLNAPGFLHMHIAVAVVVLGVVLAHGGRAWAFEDQHRVVSRLGHALLWVIGVQFLLGFAALAVTVFMPPDSPVWIDPVVTTLHQTTGALLLATATALWVWQLRLTPRYQPAEGTAAPIDRPTGQPA